MSLNDAHGDSTLQEPSYMTINNNEDGFQERTQLNMRQLLELFNQYDTQQKGMIEFVCIAPILIKLQINQPGKAGFPYL